MKYTTFTMPGNIITRVGIAKELGYFESVIECFLPDEGTSKKDIEKWVRENNIRMKAICKFLNDNNY